jgi:hypothetical protein
MPKKFIFTYPISETQEQEFGIEVDADRISHLSPKKRLKRLKSIEQDLVAMGKTLPRDGFLWCRYVEWLWDVMDYADGGNRRHLRSNLPM